MTHITHEVTFACNMTYITRGCLLSDGIQHV